jgi:hypothetical protein
VRLIADQLIADYRNATHEGEGPLDALGTIASWQATAADYGEEFQEDDWVSLVQELAPTRQTAAKSQHPPRRTYGLHRALH